MSSSATVRWLALPVATLALLAGAGCRDGDEPEDFAQFADQIARAAEDGDVAFFTDRVQGRPYTCTEEDVEASTGPDAPEEPICLEAGYEFDAVPIASYGAAGTITTPEVLIRDLERFFAMALPQEEDNYGSGEVRLYATALPLLQTGAESELRTAILTAMHEFQGTPRRFVRGIDFEFVDGGWLIRGETAAGFPVAVDLLEPASAALVYAEWMAY